PATPGKRKPALEEEEEPVAGKKKPTRVADTETEEYALAGAAGKKGGRAAVEEEESEEIEEPEAPKGKAAAKPAKGGRGWLGGALVGAVLGTAACLGVWVAGYEPPEGWRLGGPPKKTTPVGPGPQQQPVVTRPSVNDAPQLLKSGDLAKAAEALTTIE